MAATVRSGVDPRIRARRIEVRRHEGRRRLRRLTWFLVALALLVVAYGVTRTPLLAVHQIDISGNHNTSTAAIRQAAGIKAGAPMVDLSASAAASRIERLPWVASATVSRDWPRTVKVAVTERQPAARIAAGSSWLVVDLEGRVLAVDAAAPDGLAPIEWSGAAAAPGAKVSVPVDLVRLAAALPADLRPQVAAVARDAGGLELRLAQGGLVRIGEASALRDKLVAASTLLASPAAKCAAVIDVQVPNAPTLTQGGGCA